MFTAATTFLAVARSQVLPQAELQSRFGLFRKNCIGLLHSTNLRNTLVSQLESLLGFLQSTLFQDESTRESRPGKMSAGLQLINGKAVPTSPLSPIRVTTASLMTGLSPPPSYTRNTYPRTALSG